MEELTPKNNGKGYEQASTSNDAASSQSWERRIEKVPAWVRRDEHNKSDYNPAVVSFGPYHHGKPELKLVEDFKPKALELFTSGSGKDTDFFYNKVVEVIHDLRRCYVENSTDEYDDAVFARMMLDDACFIIINVDRIVEKYSHARMVMIGHLGVLVTNLISRDMSLLENQIPFWFLKLLIYLGYGEDEGKEMLRRCLSFWLSWDYEQTGESNEEEEPLHLLEACRRLIVADAGSKDDEANRWSIFKWLSSQSATIGEACQRRCLSKFRKLWNREKINRVFNLKKLYVHSFRHRSQSKGHSL